MESDVLEDSASSEEKTDNVLGKERRNAVKKELKSAGRMGRESFSDEEKVNVFEWTILTVRRRSDVWKTEENGAVLGRRTLACLFFLFAFQNPVLCPFHLLVFLLSCLSLYTFLCIFSPE